MILLPPKVCASLGLSGGFDGGGALVVRYVELPKANFILMKVRRAVGVYALLTRVRGSQ